MKGRSVVQLSSSSSSIASTAASFYDVRASLDANRSNNLMPRNLFFISAGSEFSVRRHSR